MLEIKNVSVKFTAGAGVLAVDSMSLELTNGGRTAIVGETGSGKSVLLLAILRLLPANAIITGSIKLDGENLLEVNKKRLCQVRGGLISYVPQSSGLSMNPLLKVGYQIGEPLIEHKQYSKKQAIAASIPLMRKFKLSNEEKLAFDYPHTFSGGMRQRAMMAMGISAEAKVILADEPTKGLDSQNVNLVVNVLNDLQSQSLLSVTHDLNFARRISQNICVMYASQQVEYANTEELIHHPLHPYTQDMIDAMPENGMVYQDIGFAPPHSSYLEKSTGCRYSDNCRFRFEKCVTMPPIFDIQNRKVRCWKYDPGN